MGDFIYNGEHSIDFKTEDETVWANTWLDWKLAPSVRPVVNPPEPKKEYVDVPGADGSLDYTEALTDVRYQNRTGSWTFLIDNGYWDWSMLYTEFMTRYQGKKIYVRLTDDPDYMYTGRIEINQFNQNKDYSSFTINYTLEPYKYFADSAMGRWWKWDELFGTPAYFGPISVKNYTERNILNPRRGDVTEVYAGASSSMSFELFRYSREASSDPNHPIIHAMKEDTRYHQKDIEMGDYSEEPIFTLNPGEVVLMKIYGDGILYLDVGAGKRL